MTNIVPAGETTVKEISKRIFFAHQSVGFNILSGIERVAASVKLVKLTDNIFPETIPPAIYHCQVGRNTDPISKISEFKNILFNEDFGGKIDIAGLKLCYVDIDRDTDIKGLFKHYSDMIESIENKYPNLSILHFTIPLTVHQSSRIQSRIKSFIFGDINIRRNEYNDLIRNKYGGSKTLFDLAAIEAFRPDGKRESFSYKGKTYDALFPGYSNDGGHLNEAGQIKVASEFLKILTQ